MAINCWNLFSNWIFKYLLCCLRDEPEPPPVINFDEINLTNNIFKEQITSHLV